MDYNKVAKEVIEAVGKDNLVEQHTVRHVYVWY